MKIVVFFILHMFIQVFVVGQNLYDSIALDVKIDSINTSELGQTSENGSDTFLYTVCQRIVYFTIDISNQSYKKVKVVDDSYMLDIANELFDCEVERYDSIRSVFIPIVGPLINQLWTDKPKNLYLNPNDSLRFSHRHSYSTRINERNRIRIVLQLPGKEYKKYRLYSKWIDIDWQGMEVYDK